MRIFHGLLQLPQRHVFPVLENKVAGEEEFVLPLPHDLDEVILGVERASSERRGGRLAPGVGPESIPTLSRTGGSLEAINREIIAFRSDIL